MHPSLRYALLGFSILCCGGETINVGSNGSDANGTGTGGSSAGSGASAGNGSSSASAACERPPSAAPTWSDPATCVVSSDSPFVGTWVASVTGHNQVDTLTVTIDGIGAAGELCGSVSYGHGPPLPVPQDPTAVFPPGNPEYEMGQGGNPSSWGPLKGASYTLTDTVVNPPLVEFDTLLFEPWKDWCALQTPFAWDDANSCGCLPNLPIGAYGESCYLSNGQTSVEYPCAQVTLCNMANVCECTSAGCTAARKGNDPFRLEFNGASLSGTWNSMSVVFSRE